MPTQNNPVEVAHLLRALATGQEHKANKIDVIFTAAADLIDAGAADTRRLDWLEEAVKKSETGVSFDNAPMNRKRTLHGIRLMRRFYTTAPKATLREALDEARLRMPTVR